MSGIILKMLSIENRPSLRQTRTIKIKLGCLLNATGPREPGLGAGDAEVLVVPGKGLCSPETLVTGPRQKWILGQMNPGFNPLLPFLHTLPQYKYS